jgi:polyisoprenoid-binding protein YceI
VSGTITVDRDSPASNAAEATIEVASIDTGNQKRDTHLRSGDFFDATRFPSIRFKSTSWQKTGSETFDVAGDLTIKDVTRHVIVKVTSPGFGSGGAAGEQLSAWEATATINKKHFNLKDPPMLDAALGDDVAVTITIEARKKA